MSWSRRLEHQEFGEHRVGRADGQDQLPVDGFRDGQDDPIPELAALPVLTKSGFAALFLTAMDPLATFARTAGVFITLTGFEPLEPALPRCPRAVQPRR